MEPTITKKKILQAINELPEQTTVEEAIERLTLLHKVSIGLEQSAKGQGRSQAEIEAHFRRRRNARPS